MFEYKFNKKLLKTKKKLLRQKTKKNLNPPNILWN